jgi:hypothetical protein
MLFMPFSNCEIYVHKLDSIASVQINVILMSKKLPPYAPTGFDLTTSKAPIISVGKNRKIEKYRSSIAAQLPVSKM